MELNARKASLALPGVTGTARVGIPTATVLPLLEPGDIAVIDHVDLDRETATALVEAGVRAVVNAAPMISGRYANLGPEELAEAGVLLVDGIGQAGLARIPDDQRIRIHAGGVFALLPGGQMKELASGRVVDLEQVHHEMEQPRTGPSVGPDSPSRPTGESARRGAELLDGTALPTLATRISGRPVVVVAQADHVRLRAVRAFVRAQAPVMIAVGTAADDLIGLSWAPDVVVVTAGDPSSLPSADALRVAADVVLVAARGSSLEEQATIESVSGAPHLVDTSAPAEEVALLLADRYAASLVVAVGLDDRLELGHGLVDAETVGRLHSGGPGSGQLLAVALAGLVALLAAVAVTPVGQDWAHAVLDHLGRLT